MIDTCKLQNNLAFNNQDAEKKLTILKKHFFIQEDGVFAGNNLMTGKPSPYQTEDVDSLLKSHILGLPTRAKNLKSGSYEFRPFRAGSYTIQIGSSLTKFLCIDIDGGDGHKNPLKYPDVVAADLYSKALVVGVTPYLEKSKSCAGWHLWIFFDQFVEASKVRKLGFLICREDYELQHGGLSHVKSGKGLEVFPKQDFVAKESFGNLVWLPWYYNAQEGGNQFYELVEGGVC